MSIPFFRTRNGCILDLDHNRRPAMYIGLTNVMRAEAVGHQHCAATAANTAMFNRWFKTPFPANDAAACNRAADRAAICAHHARTLLFQLIGDTATEDELPLCDYTATTWTYEEAVAECYSRLVQRHAAVSYADPDIVTHTRYLKAVPESVYFEAYRQFCLWAARRA